MLYEVITQTGKQSDVALGIIKGKADSGQGKANNNLNVITSYSIHYTKLYDIIGRRLFLLPHVPVI